MTVIALIIWFVILVVLFCICVGAVWGVWSLLAITFFRRKVLFVGLGLPVSAVVVMTAFAALWYSMTTPTSVFQNEFSMPPPADTTPINSSVWSLGDSATIYLHFTTSRTTLSKITAGWQPGTYSFSTNAAPPDWYRPRSGGGVETYSKELSAYDNPMAPGQVFASEFRIIRFDPSTGDAWYEFHGVD